MVCLKKGQTEIVGLLIVVILLVIGGLFYVKFVVLKPESKGADEIVQVQAYNLMNSILNIKLCNNNVTVRDAIKACKFGNMLCGQDACSYLENELKSIISVSTPKDYLDYEFKAGKPDGHECVEPFFEIETSSCRYGVTSPRYINVEANYCTMLKLCRKNIN